MRKSTLDKGTDDSVCPSTQSDQHLLLSLTVSIIYRNDPIFLDRKVWANSANPDQTAPRGAV